MAKRRKDRKRSEKAKGKNRPDLSLLVMLPQIGGIFGCAGGFFMAMVFCLFTLVWPGVHLGAGVLVRGLVDSIFVALAKTFTLGLPFALCVGFFVTFRERKNSEDWKSEDWVLTPILPTLLTLAGVAAILYSAMAVYWVVRSALEMNHWGTYLGSALGLFLGGVVAVYDARSKEQARSAKDQKKAKGASFYDLDWWRAETSDQEIDAD